MEEAASPRAENLTDADSSFAGVVGISEAEAEAEAEVEGVSNCSPRLGALEYICSFFVDGKNEWMSEFVCSDVT